MKRRKTVIVIVMAMLVSLAFFVPAGAIGFDAEQAYASVFVVYSGEALGSGFAIGEDCIVSNAHVIDDQSDIEVASYDGAVFDAQIVLLDESLDIVILKVEGQTFPYLKVADYNDTAIGADVYAIGAPNSMAYTLTKGVLSAKDRDLGRYEYLQIDAALNSGNSGGPLLNDAGEVIGVNTLKMSDSEGIGLAIPMTTVCEYLRNNGIELDENGNVVGTQSAASSSAQSSAQESAQQSEQPSDFGEPADAAGTEQTELIYMNNQLKAALGLSVIGNILLIIVVIVLARRERKKRKDVQNSRADFEIEILE